MLASRESSSLNESHVTMKPSELTKLISKHSSNAKVNRVEYEKKLLNIVTNSKRFDQRVVDLHRERERMEEEAEANRSFDPEILHVVISYKAR